MGIYETAVGRRSIRRFKPTPVQYEVLEKCVDSARLAPSGRNRQTLEYIIVNDEGLLPQVYATVGTWGGKPAAEGGPPEGHRPTAYIITLVDIARDAALGHAKSTNINIGLAAENMTLVALEQGVGSCLTMSFKGDELRKILNVPAKYDIAFLMALGYPDERGVVEPFTDSIDTWVDAQGVRHVPKKKLEDIVHINRFD